MKSLKEQAEIIKSVVGLHFEPVGVKFYKTIPSNGQKEVDNHRFCQLIMRARRGEELLLTKDGITCPAAAAALGFKPFPKNLQDGTMLCGYGIFKKKDAGINVMNAMPRLAMDKYSAVEVKPLKEFSELPDIITVEDEVEKLMWIALAYLNERGGRLEFSTSILQAACVDSVVLPFLSGRINMSFGCYGCRDATDAAPGEALLGFPGKKLPMVTENLAFLKSQAIDRSRAKNVYKAFAKRVGVLEPDLDGRMLTIPKNQL